MAPPRKIFPCSSAEGVRRLLARRKEYLATRDKGPSLVRRPGKLVKHPNRHLPVWAIILEWLEDGQWYGTPHVAERLKSAGMPKGNLGWLWLGYRRGYVDKASNPLYETDAQLKYARIGATWTMQQRMAASRHVFRIKDKGRKALERCRAKYGIADSKTAAKAGDP